MSPSSNICTLLLCFIFSIFFALGTATSTSAASQAKTAAKAQQDLAPVTGAYGQWTTNVTATTIIATTTSNGTNSDGYPMYLGFIAAAVAVLFYGTMFVPVKKYETGDGMFYQWVMCSGVWMTGTILQMVRPAKFYPLVMFGGAIWTTGNLCVVAIIKTIGLGLGLCIWNTFNLLGGWASGRFGWFGLNAEVPKHEALNYVGVFLAVASSVIYVFVKNDITPPTVEFVLDVDEEQQPLVRPDSRYSSNNSDIAEQETEGKSFVDKLSPTYKRIVGVGLSVFSGLMYGNNFVPAIHVQDRVDGASQNSLDYVYAQYCGIFLTSSVYFVAYIIYKKNKPKVYPKAILPGMVSGVMFGIATGCWFVANKALSEPVAFPIITTLPGAIASLFWGVFVFKEIKGRRNIIILLVAVTVTVSGAVLAGVSKG